MSNTVGALIKEARMKAGLTQAALAELVDGASSKDISAAERGQKELTTAQLKAIAKATGVTQKSLLDAAAGKTSSASSAKKETSSKKETASKKETSSKNETAKKTESSKKSSDTGLKLTATEKKLVELYRKADSDTKKSVMATLKGEKPSGLFETLIGSVGTLLTREGPQDTDPGDGEKTE